MVVNLAIDCKETFRLSYGDIDPKRTPAELDARADAAFTARLLSQSTDFADFGRHLRAVMAEYAEEGCTHVDTTDAVLEALTRCCMPAFGTIDWPTYYTAEALCAGAQLLNDDERREAANATSMMLIAKNPLTYQVTRGGQEIGLVGQIDGLNGWFWRILGEPRWHYGSRDQDEAWDALLAATGGK